MKNALRQSQKKFLVKNGQIKRNFTNMETIFRIYAIVLLEHEIASGISKSLTAKTNGNDWENICFG